jgi:Zn-finger nucleic acid-binding protein
LTFTWPPSNPWCAHRDCDCRTDICPRCRAAWTAAEAAGLVARAAVEMTGALTKKSAGAARQQRYRERNKASHRDATPEPSSVTKRNESVTRDAEPEASQTVTNRNESVTPLRSDETRISYFPSSSENLSVKEESKKERVSKKRNAPLPADWSPSGRSHQVAEEHGVSVQIVEQIFRDYLKSSGKLYADYDAAFNNFLRNQRNFNGNANAKPKSSDHSSR